MRLRPQLGHIRIICLPSFLLIRACSRYIFTLQLHEQNTAPQSHTRKERKGFYQNNQPFGEPKLINTTLELHFKHLQASGELVHVGNLRSRRRDRTYLSRNVLVYGSCHGGAADPDQDQHRQDQGCGQDPPRQPRIPEREQSKYCACVRLPYRQHAAPLTHFNGVICLTVQIDACKTNRERQLKRLYSSS